jgi:hypothetical protein
MKAGHPFQDKIQKQCIEKMKNNIGQMKPSGGYSMEPIIGHKG